MRLDEVTKTWVRARELPDWVQWLKRCITYRVSVAVELTMYELVSGAQCKAAATQISENLSTITQLIHDTEQVYRTMPVPPRIAATDPNDLLGLPFMPITRLAQSSDLRLLLEQMRIWAASIGGFQANHRPPPSASRNWDPLTNLIIGTFASLWESETGKRPSKSRSGPFVEFIVAVWELLELPAPVPPTSWATGLAAASSTVLLSTTDVCTELSKPKAVCRAPRFPASSQTS